VAVLSNNDGCIVARSDELKALGVPMGAPVHQLGELIRRHRVQVFSSNYALYGDMSGRVMDVLGQFTPQLEVYSIDESFLDLTGCAPDLAAYGQQIRATVGRCTGIPISIGIAPTKVLAKAANKLAKQHRAGVLELMQPAQQSEALAEFPVEDLWGIGERWAQQLRALGIDTALQLRDADPATLRRRFSVVMARIALELRGTACLTLEEITPAKQQIRASRTFGRKLTALADLQSAVAAHVTRAAVKLRRQHSLTRDLLVFMHTNLFSERDPPYRASWYTALPVATDDTRVLLRYALAGIARLYRAGYRYQKAGVMFLDLLSRQYQQTDLFEPDETARAWRLMAVIDRINARMGRGTIRFAAEGFGDPAKMRVGRRTPAYTTQWKELPVVKAAVPDVVLS
jgi:DNA polymerase V